MSRSRFLQRTSHHCGRTTNNSNVSGSIFQRWLAWCAIRFASRSWALTWAEEDSRSPARHLQLTTSRHPLRFFDLYHSQRGPTQVTFVPNAAQNLLHSSLPPITTSSVRQGIGVSCGFRPCRDANRSLTIPDLERTRCWQMPKWHAKSYAQTWIRITHYRINDMRTIFPQTIDSKRS